MGKAKIATIKNLTPPKNVKGVRSFLSHASFYRRFINNFSKIVRPLCRLLERDEVFMFDESYLYAFIEIKKRLISTPIMISLDWDIPFEIT